jgi:hypothetical protein
MEQDGKCGFNMCQDYTSGMVIPESIVAAEAKQGERHDIELERKWKGKASKASPLVNRGGQELPL